MRIAVRNLSRKYLLAVEVDQHNPARTVQPTGEPGQQAPSSLDLNWDQVFDDEQHMRRCPVCGCHELFSRKDFPQVTGFVIVILAATLAMVLFGMREVRWGFGVLGTVALIDSVIFFFAGRCLVCYRCRSEFRNLKIPRDHPKWELATGEKYPVSAGHDSKDKPPQ